jgi:hypothetical protein
VCTAWFHNTVTSPSSYTGLGMCLYHLSVVYYYYYYYYHHHHHYHHHIIIIIVAYVPFTSFRTVTNLVTNTVWQNYYKIWTFFQKMLRVSTSSMHSKANKNM